MSKSAGKNGTPRLVIVLGVITFVVSLLLSVVNGMTAPVIEKNQQALLREALGDMFPLADGFDKLSQTLNPPVTEAYRAVRGGEVLGVVTIAEPQGYADVVRLAVAIGMDGTVRKVHILRLSETVGIGSQVQEESYLGQYTGKTEFSAVQAISGASISSAAVLSGVQASADLFSEYILSRGGD